MLGPYAPHPVYLNTVGGRGSLGVLAATALADNGGTTRFTNGSMPRAWSITATSRTRRRRGWRSRGPDLFGAVRCRWPRLRPARRSPSPPGPRTTAVSSRSPQSSRCCMNVYRATAVVQTSPALRPGDDVHLFDGRQGHAGDRASAFSSRRLTAASIPLQAVIEDSSGQIVCETQHGHLLRAPALRAEPAQPGPPLARPAANRCRRFCARPPLREAPWPLSTRPPRRCRISIPPICSMRSPPASSCSMPSCAPSMPTWPRRTCSPSVSTRPRPPVRATSCSNPTA